MKLSITTLTATDHHPIWDVTTKRFVDAIDIRVGDKVLTDKGTTITVTGAQDQDKAMTAYNLQVDTIHTYYVGSTPVLVHNSCASDLSGNAGDIVVLGRLPDTAVAKDWAGHVVLDNPNWTLEANDEFISAAIAQRRTIYLATPTEGNMVQAIGKFAGQPTVYARELGMLGNAGYVRIGDYMVPR